MRRIARLNSRLNGQLNGQLNGRSTQPISKEKRKPSA
jgi:hypothetical protein